MRLMQILILRLRSLFARRRIEEELDEELRYHFEREMELRMGAGMNEKEARYAARQAMGAMEQRKEECRDSRGVRSMQDLFLDVKYALRSLARTPHFTLIAVVVLMLAIGANTAVFTVVNSVLLRPLPFQEADRLFLISMTPRDLFFDPGPIMTDRDYLEFKLHNHSFASVSNVWALGARKTALTGRGEPTIVATSKVGTDFFRVLQVKPLMGGDFQLQGQPDRAVMLSHRLWESRFGASGQAVGQDIVLDAVPYTIVGVMPNAFTFQNADSETRV